VGKKSSILELGSGIGTDDKDPFMKAEAIMKKNNDAFAKLDSLLANKIVVKSPQAKVIEDEDGVENEEASWEEK